MRLLVTGATGKVGQAFLARLLSEDRRAGATVRVLCHNRTVPASDRVEVIQGSIADREVVRLALRHVTHVFHMATVKEDPVQAMDVSVKGMFWLLEEFRTSPTAKQFVLIGGDCVVGHCMVPYDAPVTETSPRRSYPGVYALSKVLEEVMLEQYQIQYGIDGTILRAPWIMEKDDFRHALSFRAQFGGPPWSDLLGREEIARYAELDAVPLLRDVTGAPLRRNFIHVSDLVTAILAALDNPAAEGQLFNISMNAPIDYAEATAHLAATRGIPVVEIATPFHSNWLDNAKARLLLGWRPLVDFIELVERAWAYQRAPDDPRIVWYPG